MLAVSTTTTTELGYLYMLVHASTKVFIFMLFGYIIDINGGVRDLRKMGGFYMHPHILSYCLWGLALLSSLPLFFLPSLKDGILLKAIPSNFTSDLSVFFLMISSILNYFYIYRLFFKIFFGDLLSFQKTYFSNMGLVGGFYATA